jgi:hypothetical protein
MANISETEKQLLLAAHEATFAYHTAVHNHSFKSMDCTTTIVRKLFNDKFIVFLFYQMSRFLGEKMETSLFLNIMGTLEYNSTKTVDNVQSDIGVINRI